MSLASLQAAFMDGLHDEDAAEPAGWNARQKAGMHVYRNAYRVSLVDALRETYPRTADYAGEDAFRAAAAHHLISHPPSSWTLDQAGLGFADTVAELFGGNPELPSIARLEWSMHMAFVAQDASPLDNASFAAGTASFQEDDWANMQLRFLPSVTLFATEWNLVDWWMNGNPLDLSVNIAACVVWRESEKPVFRMLDAIDARAVDAMKAGSIYGELYELLVAQLPEQEAIARAGTLLSSWIELGWLEHVSLA